MADPLLNSPLNEQHLVDLNKALDSISVARDQITLARRAGLNVDSQAKALDDAENQIRQIKQVYFPGR